MGYNLRLQLVNLKLMNYQQLDLPWREIWLFPTPLQIIDEPLSLIK